jgi:murein DD-endopeptidase MepM/ murein hydrolase activator NlpD
MPKIPQLKNPFGGRRTLTQKFGENPGMYAWLGIKGHNGLDFALPQEEKVDACDTGVVQKRGWDVKGYGNYLVIKHSWGESLYAHLKQTWTAPGAKVARGQGIGRADTTGWCTGPHLHFAIRPNNYDYHNGYLGYIDPLPYLPDYAKA